jgi:hypothetical protein
LESIFVFYLSAFAYEKPGFRDFSAAACESCGKQLSPILITDLDMYFPYLLMLKNQAKQTNKKKVTDNHLLFFMQKNRQNRGISGVVYCISVQGKYTLGRHNSIN